MSVVDLIKEVETLFPNHKWLARRLGGAGDLERFGEGYLVHIYRDDADGNQVESYLSSGAKLEYAFRGSVALAKRATESAGNTAGVAARQW